MRKLAIFATVLGSARHQCSLTPADMAAVKRTASEANTAEELSEGSKRAPRAESERLQEEEDEPEERRKIPMAVVCSSNQNRSMEAHCFLMFVPCLFSAAHVCHMACVLDPLLSFTMLSWSLLLAVAARKCV